MPHYRRAFVPGGTYFFTLVTHERRHILTTPLARQCLRNALRITRERWPFTIDAIVLLPDHLHTIWTLPPGDADYSMRIGFLKKGFTKAWLAAGGTESFRSDSQHDHRRRGVWQRRFWEHTIRDENDLIAHVEYIHYNPVKHGLVSCPHAWAYSSFARFVRKGVYDADWGCSCERECVVPDFNRIEKSVGE